MSSSSTRETSESSYNYESEEGQIQCLTSKQYDFTSSSSDEWVAAFKEKCKTSTPENGQSRLPDGTGSRGCKRQNSCEEDTLPNSAFDDEERKEVEEIISNVFKGEVKLYPRYMATWLKRHLPNVYQRIMNTFACPSVFMFAAFSLTKHLDLDGFVRIPKHVLFDICVFRTTKPIMILTFVSDTTREESVLFYNARLSKFALRSINEDLKLDLSVVHGVLGEEDCISDDAFTEKIEQLESNTTVFALPMSLQMDSNLHRKVVKSFLTRFEDRESSKQLKDMTKPEKGVSDQTKSESCRHHNCIYRTMYQKLLTKLKRRDQGVCVSLSHQTREHPAVERCQTIAAIQIKKQGATLKIHPSMKPSVPSSSGFGTYINETDIESEELDVLRDDDSFILEDEIKKLRREVRQLAAELKVLGWRTVPTTLAAGSDTVDKGCNLSLKDADGDNVLHLACISGNIDIVRYLLSRDDIDKDRRGKYGDTAVYGRKKIFDLFVSRGCMLSLQSENFDNILHVACIGGNASIVKKLLEKEEALINSRGQHGKTPVMVAAQRGDAELFNVLVEYDCDLSIRDDDNNCVLHVACIGGSATLVSRSSRENTLALV
ncbi:uncharacterized protein LOC124282255 [Haliotis rubra]|uniref:uncharacterized protein LOC124282255 n=1 Tax=Haliotis rubra TaxID=36100 RepID=UPI001EE534AE|nr:uncharacterized protein LOC124282255 [Haliotis rubra]